MENWYLILGEVAFFGVLAILFYRHQKKRIIYHDREILHNTLKEISEYLQDDAQTAELGKQILNRLEVKDYDSIIKIIEKIPDLPLATAEIKSHLCEQLRFFKEN